MERTIPIISRRLFTSGATPLDIPIAPHVDVSGALSGVLIVRVHLAPSGGTWTVHGRNSCISDENPNIDFIDTSREVVSVAVSGITRNLWHGSLSAPIGEELDIYLSTPAMIGYIAISVDLTIREIWGRRATSTARTSQDISVTNKPPKPQRHRAQQEHKPLGSHTATYEERSSSTRWRTLADTTQTNPTTISINTQEIFAYTTTAHTQQPPKEVRPNTTLGRNTIQKSADITIHNADLSSATTLAYLSNSPMVLDHDTTATFTSTSIEDVLIAEHDGFAPPPMLGPTRQI